MGVGAWQPVQQGGDEICGGRRNGSVEEWAQHFGSWTFRQLVLQPSLLKLLRGKDSARESQTVDQEPASVWLRVKDSLASNDFDRIETAPAREALRRVESSIADGSLLHVIGIFEHWSRTMELLDMMMPLPTGQRWAKVAQQEKESYGSHAWKQQQAADLEEAHESTAVRRLLQADVRIYAAALQRFEALRRDHAPACEPGTICHV